MGIDDRTPQVVVTKNAPPARGQESLEQYMSDKPGLLGRGDKPSLSERRERERQKDLLLAKIREELRRRKE